jgi:SAM-dependent methyltransferase
MIKPIDRREEDNQMNETARTDQSKEDSETRDNKAIFDEIYISKIWGFQSGSGSDPVNAKDWINLVNRVLEIPEFTSILDIGSGDWRLGSEYNSAGKNYLGLEVSEEALRISEKFSSSNVQFVQGDAELIELPKVDLILVKDVLQHLSSKSIIQIYSKIQKSCKVALICNDFSTSNSDVSNGGFRGLDLRKEPFRFDLQIFDVFGDRHKVIYAYLDRETLDIETVSELARVASYRPAGE